MIWVTTLEFRRRGEKVYLEIDGIIITRKLRKVLLFFYYLFRRQFLNKDFLNSKCIIVHYEDLRPIASSLDGLVAFAWICEKMKINLKIKNPDSMVWRHFENDKLINITNKSTHKFQPSMQKKFFENDVAWLGIFFIPSAYGHKILSKLAINPQS